MTTWNERDHPRWPYGSKRGGEFRKKGGGGDVLKDRYGKKGARR